MGASYPWMLFILGILLTFVGGYLSYSNPDYGVSAMTGEPFISGYPWQPIFFLSIPGIVLVAVALWKAKKSD
jgi:hypothetical protein